MLYANNYELILTGTNFGVLSAYPKANYIDGYFYSDLFGNVDINYTNTISGNIFLSAATDAYISSLPGLLVWLDTSDKTKVLTGKQTGFTGITGLIDKSPNNRLFRANTPIEIVHWPLSGGYLNTLSAANLRSTNYFINSSFVLSLSSPFTLIFVYKETSSILGDTYPLTILSEYNGVTGDIVLINNFTETTSASNGYWGFRESAYGIKLTGIPFKEFGVNYFVWTHKGGEPLTLSSQSLDIFNTPFSATDFYFVSGKGPSLIRGTTIGSLCGEDINDFIFGEMLLFNRVISGSDLLDIKNAINEKWNLNYLEENVLFYDTLTGGPLANTSYEDFSLLTSDIVVPMQSCVTLLTINLSTFDISESNISKVVYQHNNEIKEITSSLLLVDTDVRPVLTNNKIDIVLYPDTKKYVGTYNIRLSVYRFDATVNKFSLSGNILRCNILDYLGNSKFIDSQIINKTNDVIVVTENTEKNITFLNKLNIELPVQALTGGDVKALLNEEMETSEDDIILLSDLLADEEVVKETFKVPIIPPLPRPRINPILPN